MYAEDFCKWLEGFLDASSPQLDEAGAAKIKEKLASVTPKPTLMPLPAPSIKMPYTYPNPMFPRILCKYE